MFRPALLRSHNAEPGLLSIVIMERKSEILGLISFGIALRAIVSLYPYSGQNKPPIYGDYEAQRHWQEITVNLVPSEWYKNSSANDLLFWGLDYPPLTAYHSYLVGRILRLVDEKFVALYESRGFESKEHMAYMRLSVLAADIFILIPSFLVLGLTLENIFKKPVFIPFLTVMLVYPGQILIDNGHFQYNNISLGLAALSIAALLANRDYSAAFIFSLALNYKQMELYHALPIFAYLLQRCIFDPKNVQNKLSKFCVIAGIVVTTFCVLWYPWIKDWSIIAVIERLFPIKRGVFEDKVSNFWCALNVVYKLKDNLSNEKMALICLFSTAAVVLPINIRLFLKNGKDKLLYALMNTALSFFLFSFQVHEKSILLALLPSSSLIVFKPQLTLYLLQCGLFSMFPLFMKDKLIVPFYALSVIFLIITKITQHYMSENKFIDKLLDVFTIILFIFSSLVCWAPAPNRYPFLWPLLVAVYSFVNFFLCLLLGTYYQLS